MGLAAALNRVSNARLGDFVAPLLRSSGVSRILVFQEGIPFWVSVDIPEGWWKVHPVEGSNGWYAFRGNEEPALPGEYLEYLGHLPSIYVIPAIRAGERTWVCIPFNASDAAQRGWPDSIPRFLHLVRDAVPPGRVVQARMLGNILIYERPALNGLKPSGQTLKLAVELYMEDRKAKEQAEREAAEREKRATLGGRIEASLHHGGAELVDWVEAGEHIRVTWTWNGLAATTIVSRELAVETVGFCAAGHDREHSLASAVGLMREAHRRGHYAIDHLDRRER